MKGIFVRNKKEIFCVSYRLRLIGMQKLCQKHVFVCVPYVHYLHLIDRYCTDCVCQSITQPILPTALVSLIIETIIIVIDLLTL